VSGSDNAGVWEQSSQPPEANVGLEAKPLRTVAILQPFSKKYAFLGIFWPKFLQKNSFLMPE